MNALPVTTNALLLSMFVLSAPAWAGPLQENELNAVPEDMHYLNQTVPLSAQQEQTSVAIEPAGNAVHKKWKHSHRKNDYSLDYSSTSSRKVNRMSDAQRRDLRRQINDASHDIYISGN